MRAKPLPRSTPQAQDVSAGRILDFVNAVERELDAVHSMMIVRHGYVIAEGWWHPYSAELTHSMYSLSKSFASTTVGFAVSEGLFSLDDRVIDLLPKDAPSEVSDHLASLLVRHLLTMTMGHDVETLNALARATHHNWTASILAAPIADPPGTRFMYDSGATYLLSAIIFEVSGETLLEYLTPRLFEPLGIDGAHWESCPRGINTGGWGLNVRTEDVAKLGQLYLQGGEWEGKQLLEADWVAEATSAQVPNAGPGTNPDWSQGYGYQFWQGRHGYRGDGAFGQFCLVLPEFDAVVALTSGLGDMQAELDAVWKHLLPAFDSTDDAPSDTLDERLAALELRAPMGTATPDSSVNGVRYELEENSSPITAALVSFDPHGDEDKVSVWLGERLVSFRSGRNRWIAGETDAFGKPAPIAARGGWMSPTDFLSRVASYETPYVYDVSLSFDDSEVRLTIAENVDLSGEPFSLDVRGRIS
jgi:CubicO group peptidase (beta-lactamase class C family)